MSTLHTREEVRDGGENENFDLRCAVCGRVWARVHAPLDQPETILDLSGSSAIVPCHDAVEVVPEEVPPFEKVVRLLNNDPAPVVSYKYLYEIEMVDNMIVGFRLRRMD